MRKIVMLNRISLDGFFAGPKGEIDWFIHDPEVEKAAHEMMNPIPQCCWLACIRAYLRSLAILYKTVSLWQPKIQMS